MQRLLDDGFHICKLIKSKGFEIFFKPKTCNVVCLLNVFYFFIVKSYPLYEGINLNKWHSCGQYIQPHEIMLKSSMVLLEASITCSTVLHKGLRVQKLAVSPSVEYMRTGSETAVTKCRPLPKCQYRHFGWMPIWIGILLAFGHPSISVRTSKQSKYQSNADLDWHSP